MKMNVSLNRLFLVFCVVAFSGAVAYGQESRLIYSKEVPNAAEKVKGILQKSTAYTSVDFVVIDLGKVKTQEEFILQFGERTIRINKKRVDLRGSNSYTFIGDNDDGDRVLLSVLGNDIQGGIETTNGVFSVMTIGNNEYAIVQIDHSKLKEGCGQLQYKGPSNANYGKNLNVEIDVTKSSAQVATRAYSCKVRVLVAYTPSAMSSVSNIENIVLTAVAYTNESFSNSGINYQIELAYAGLTNYTQSNFRMDLQRVRINGDGYMDEIHGLRDKYSADVVVLLINDPNYCGMASDIYVAAGAAFCVVSTWEDCATTYYSFGHEIGHLVGCDHDPATSSNSPFPYGHGYVSPVGTNNRWRTVMAYGNECNYCPRVAYWSNPYINYPAIGGIPTGTVATHNNARVWNEQAPRVMAFRQPDNNITLTSSDVNNSTYADVVAKQTITTNGTVNFSGGSNLSLRAGSSITLMPGFSVAAGVKFSATIENIVDCN
jgi:peptidyl-Asp metalloendopeptidase